VDFFQSVMTTALAPDEIIRCVRFPVKQQHEGASYQIFNRRHGDYAIVAAAACVVLERDRVTGLRVGLCGVGAVPLSCAGVVRPFVGAVADAAWAAAVALAVSESVNPEDDARVSAVYRKELALTLVERALLRAIERTRG
jgi:carbon-monoxide dehydrogenase medium subunit